MLNKKLFVETTILDRCTIFVRYMSDKPHACELDPSGF